MHLPPMPAWVMGRRPGRTILRAAALGLLCYVVFGHVWRPVRVRGHSMHPTLRDGGLHVASLLRYQRKDPRRGEIVVIRMAGNASFYVKRVVALPGERIAFAAGQRMVNGEPAPEFYLTSPGSWEMDEVEVPSGQYFVAGDNRRVPLEDHLAGLVERKDIAGGLGW